MEDKQLYRKIMDRFMHGSMGHSMSEHSHGATP